jgi:hypothetical protein
MYRISVGFLSIKYVRITRHVYPDPTRPNIKFVFIKKVNYSTSELWLK